VHKFAGCVITNLDFKITIFFNVKIENDRATYSGRLIGSRTWTITNTQLYSPKMADKLQNIDMPF